MTEQEYTDVKKKWSRAFILGFLLRNFPNENERRKLKVVFFPGIEAFDYYQIFERAGIQAENIIGLEKTRKHYKKIQNRNPPHPFKTFNSDALKFFQETDQVFDIISLDYTGMFNRNAIDTLLTIFDRNLLNPNGGILHTNFFGMREKEQIINFYKSIGEETLLRHIYAEKLGLITKEERNEYSKLEYKPYDLSDSREYGISLFIQKYALRIKKGEYSITWLKEHGFDVRNDMKAIMDFEYIVIYTPLSQWGLTTDEIMTLKSVLNFRWWQSYLTMDIEVYDYTTPTGSHMYTDLYFLKKKEYPFSITQLPFEYDFSETTIMLEDDKLIIKKGKFPIRFMVNKLNNPENYQKALKKYAKVAKEIFRNYYLPWISIVKRTKLFPQLKKNEKPAIGKEYIIQLLVDGYLPEEIITMCSNYSVDEIVIIQEALPPKTDSIIQKQKKRKKKEHSKRKRRRSNRKK